MKKVCMKIKKRRSARAPIACITVSSLRKFNRIRFIQVILNKLQSIDPTIE